MVTTLVVEDEQEGDEGMHTQLTYADFSVCGVASSLKEAFQLIIDLNPDTVLINKIEFKKIEEKLNRSKIQLKRFFEISKLITSTLNLDEIFTFTADSVQLLVGFDHFMIFLGSKKEKNLQCVYGSEEIKHVEGCNIAYGEGIVGTCAQKNTLLLSNNVSHEKNTLRSELKMKSVIAIPLALGYTAQGILCSVKCTGEYTRADGDILQLLNELVSSAVKNALLHKKIKKSRENLKRNIEEKITKAEIILNTKKSLQLKQDWKKGLTTIAESVCDLGFDLAGIFLVDPMKTALQHCGGIPAFPEKKKTISLSETTHPGVKCILKKEIITENSSDTTHYMVWVPIVVENEAFAVLAAGATEKVFEDIENLEMLSGICAAFIDRTRFHISPAAEKTLKTECTHWLEPMEGYIVQEKKPEKTLKIFTDLVFHGVSGFVISREHPERLRQRCNLVKTPMLWLSRIKGKNTINPDDLPKLHYLIEDFTKKCHESAVLLDGLEYLIVQNTFASVLNHLQDLKDAVVLNNSRLIIPLHVEALPENQFSMLEREFTCITQGSNI